MKLAANIEAKNKNTTYTDTSLPMALIRAVFLLYLFLLLVVLPLIFHNGYVDIADTKWKYYKLFTVGYISDYGVMIFPGCAVLLIILFIWYAIDKKKNGIPFKKPLVTDYFVIAYMIVCCISTILAPVKTVVVDGYPGYYMGLYAQLSFCLLYLFASNICLFPSTEYLNSKEKNRNKKENLLHDFFFTDKYSELIPWIIVALMMMGSTVVMFIGIQNSLGIDVLRMAEISGVETGTFRSTIGNLGILAEYYTIMFVAGAYVFVYSKRILPIVFSGAWLLLAYTAALSSRSMGSAIGMLTVLFVMLLLSFESPYRFTRYMMLILLMGLSFVLTGKLAYNSKGELIIVTERVFLKATDKRIWIPFIVISIVFILFGTIITFTRKGKKPLKVVPIALRIISLVLLVAASYCLYLYIRMNTDGTLPEWLPASTDTNLLTFHENWGSYRPRMWKTILESFRSVSQDDIKLKLFGLGPDNLYILPGMVEFCKTVWGTNSILAYAHNEFINVYVNMGLLGLIAYSGIFITAAFYLIINRGFESKKRHKLKNSNDLQQKLNVSAESPARIIALTVMFGYMIQNSVGYQWVCVTTTTFILIGVGVARYRIHANCE